MSRILLVLLTIIFFSSCSSLSDKPWNETVPESVIGVFVPEQQTTLKTLLESSTGSFFDDITTSALPVLSDLEVAARKLLYVNAVFFYPSESDQLQAIWVLKNESNLLNTFRTYFARPLFVDEYHFKGITIYKLSIENRILFTLETSSLLYVSESSQALEAIVLTSIEEDSPLAIPSNFEHYSFVLNTKHLDAFISQYAAIKYFPLLKDGFNGLGISTLNYEEKNIESLSFSLTGNMKLEGESSALAGAIQYGNELITLDQYIPTDAAAFSILFSKVEPKPILNPVSPLDSVLRSNPTIGKELAAALDNEIAFVGFAPTGLTGVGENLYIRKVKDSRAVYDWLRDLSRQEIISSSDNAYYIRSSYLAKLITSGLSTYETFYLGITSEGLVISPRLGLTNRVRSDRSRRRVIAYNQTFLDIKNELGDAQSGFFYVDSKSFSSFINSYLGPNASIAAFTSKFEILAGGLQLSPDREAIQIRINAYTQKRSTQPFEEQWIAPMDGATITGKPILADIGGSSRDEIIVANSRNQVLGIANDGTIYFSAETGTDTPIGSPVVYDWYGNGQKAIFIAAGNKVYAWNTTGSALPKFPFVLSENITAPLLVTDINRDGIPEVVVATADRQTHVLDGRGEPLKGWPATTSAEVKFKPYFERVSGNWTLFALADNGLYGFDAMGRLRDGFPTFISAAFSSDPININDGLMMGASDGHIYRLSANRMFHDSLNVLRNTSYDSLAPNLRLSSMYLSNAAINAAPLFTNRLQIKPDSGSAYNEAMLIYQSANGAIFVTNQQGEIRFTTNMGQPSSNTSELILSDLQKDGRLELLAVAGFGRLYAWELFRGNRYYDLPTSAIEFPILTDLEGDGFPELIGQTRGGLRCWTLYGKTANE